MKLEDVIHEQFKQAGWQGKIVSAGHLSALQKEIEAYHMDGLVDQVLYAEYLDRFDFNLLQASPDMKSIMIVTVPQSRVRVSFKWKGQSHACIIPPTYCSTTDDQIKESMQRILIPKGYHLKKIRLPEKILAVRSGLAKYGQNNLTYVPGMGSFHRPAVFAMDIPCPEDSWGEISRLKTCENCTVCMDACPTGAIASDRFLLHAERCITFHNERSPEFPKWLDPAWHNCWVGCMFCQSFCPINQKFLHRIEDGPAFSETETDYLLKEMPPHNMPKTLTEKIEKLRISEYTGVLGRNLKAVLKNQSSA